jgi:hypothetical protein
MILIRKPVGCLPDTTGVSARFQPRWCRIRPAGWLGVSSYHGRASLGPSSVLSAPLRQLDKIASPSAIRTGDPLIKRQGLIFFSVSEQRRGNARKTVPYSEINLAVQINSGRSFFRCCSLSLHSRIDGMPVGQGVRLLNLAERISDTTLVSKMGIPLPIGLVSVLLEYNLCWSNLVATAVETD